jgi:hypothetical protein
LSRRNWSYPERRNIGGRKSDSNNLVDPPHREACFSDAIVSLGEIFNRVEFRAEHFPSATLGVGSFLDFCSLVWRAMNLGHDSKGTHIAVPCNEGSLSFGADGVLGLRDKIGLSGLRRELFRPRPFGADCYSDHSATIDTLAASEREQTELWLKEYNEERPHKPLGHLTPREYLLTQKPEISSNSWV